MRHPSPGALLKAPTSVQTAYIFSERQWCGALRASEWDHEKNIMTVWYQGKDICLLKKPPLEKDNAMKMVMMLKNVMRLHPHALKTQLMDLGSQYHLAWGEHRLPELFIKICMKNKAIFEKALWEVRQETVGRD